MAVKLKTDQSARFYHTQQVHYLYRRFNGFDIDQTATQPGKFYLGVLPANCLPLETYVRVNTAFTSGEVIVGTSAAGSSAVAVSTLDVANGTTGVYVIDRYYGTLSTVDVPLYIQTKSSGQSNGQVDVWQAYLPAYPST
jgi:hypothetical protein